MSCLSPPPPSHTQDERIHLTGEMLRGMRAVKMLAWEQIFMQKVSFPFGFPLYVFFPPR